MSDETNPAPVPRFECEIQPRVADLNFGGHVDNVTILRIFDEARTRFLGMPAQDVGHGGRWFSSGLLADCPDSTGILVAQHRIQYQQELWADPDRAFSLSLWVSHLGTSSFAVAGEIRQSAEAPVAALAECSLVLTDRATASPRHLDDGLRARLAQHLGQPPGFRERRPTS